MPTLTDRQIQLLKFIIEKYIDSAVPVGSETIEKEFDDTSEKFIEYEKQRAIRK